jgi:hypothetical protein
VWVPCQSVVRVLLQLTFAQRRRLAITDALFLQTARLAASPPTSYRAAHLVRHVFDHVWRLKQPLATIDALVDEAMKHGDAVAPAAISSLVHVPWSVPNRVSLVARLATCASCKATAAESIRQAKEAEMAALSNAARGSTP